MLDVANKKAKTRLVALVLAASIGSGVGCGRHSDMTSPRASGGTLGKTIVETGKMLNPKFPIVQDKYQMTKDWSISLPEKFNRRMDDGDLVLWRHGFTVWVTCWNNNHGESKEDRLAFWQKKIAKEAFDIEQSSDKSVLRLAYRLREKAEDNRVAAFYGFAIGANGHVQLGIYFDDEKDVELARNLWLSLEENASASKLEH
jgi:hypothetical protein